MDQSSREILRLQSFRHRILAVSAAHGVWEREPYAAIDGTTAAKPAETYPYPC